MARKDRIETVEKSRRKHVVSATTGDSIGESGPGQRVARLLEQGFRVLARRRAAPLARLALAARLAGRVDLADRAIVRTGRRLRRHRRIPREVTRTLAGIDHPAAPLVLRDLLHPCPLTGADWPESAGEAWLDLATCRSPRTDGILLEPRTRYMVGPRRLVRLLARRAAALGPGDRAAPLLDAAEGYLDILREREDLALIFELARAAAACRDRERVARIVHHALASREIKQDKWEDVAELARQLYRFGEIEVAEELHAKIRKWDAETSRLYRSCRGRMWIPGSAHATMSAMDRALAELARIRERALAGQPTRDHTAPGFRRTESIDPADLAERLLADLQEAGMDPVPASRGELVDVLARGAAEPPGSREIATSYVPARGEQDPAILRGGPVEEGVRGAKRLLDVALVARDERDQELAAAALWHIRRMLAEAPDGEREEILRYVAQELLGDEECGSWWLRDVCEDELPDDADLFVRRLVEFVATAGDDHLRRVLPADWIEEHRLPPENTEIPLHPLLAHVLARANRLLGREEHALWLRGMVLARLFPSIDRDEIEACVDACPTLEGIADYLPTIFHDAEDGFHVANEVLELGFPLIANDLAKEALARVDLCPISLGGFSELEIMCQRDMYQEFADLAAEFSDVHDQLMAAVEECEHDLEEIRRERREREGGDPEDDDEELEADDE